MDDERLSTPGAPEEGRDDGTVRARRRARLAPRASGSVAELPVREVRERLDAVRLMSTPAGRTPRVRRIAVQARRNGDTPIAELAEVLGAADLSEQLHLIRAFGWLSLLANTAEDVHTERRRRFHRDAGRAAHEGTLPALFA